MKLKISILLTVKLVFLSGCFKPSSDQYIQNVSYIQSINATGEESPGNPAPELVWYDQDGNLVQLSEHIRGKVTLINIWATWCTFCKMTFTALRAVDMEYSDEDLVVLGVSTHNTNSEKSYLLDYIYRFVQERDMQFPTLIDTNDGEIWKAFGLVHTGVPTTIMIDRNGIVVKAFSGNRNKAQFMEEIDALL